MENLTKVQQYFDKNPKLEAMYISDSGQCFYSVSEASYFIAKSGEKLHKVENPYFEKEIEKPVVKKNKK